MTPLTRLIGRGEQRAAVLEFQPTIPAGPCIKTAALKFDDGAMKGDGKKRCDIKKRGHSDDKKDIPGRSQWITGPLKRPAHRIAPLFAADDRNEEAPFDEWDTDPQVDRLVRLGSLGYGVVDGHALIVVQRIKCFRRQLRKQPIVMHWFNGFVDGRRVAVSHQRTPCFDKYYQCGPGNTKSFFDPIAVSQLQRPETADGFHYCGPIEMGTTISRNKPPHRFYKGGTGR